MTPRMRTIVSLRPSIFCMRRKQLPHSQRSVETMRVRSRRLKRIIGCWRPAVGAALSRRG